MRLRSRQRIRSQADFAAVRKEGRRQFGAAFVFSYRRRTAAQAGDLPRFAVIAPRRVGPAVVRNRLKRRMRELFRAAQAAIPAGVDVVVVLQPRAVGAGFDGLQRQFAGALQRAGFVGTVPPPSAVPAPPSANPSEVPLSD